LEKPQVDARGVDVINLAQMTAGHYFLHRYDSRIVDEGVSDHDHTLSPFALRHNFRGLSHAGREGLFH